MNTIKNSISGTLAALMCLAVGLITFLGAPAQAGTPGVPEVSVTGLAATFNGSANITGADLTTSCDVSHYAKRVKLYVRNVDTGDYLQANGTFASTYYEFLSNTKTAPSQSFNGASGFSQGGNCSSGASPVRWDVPGGQITLPSGNYRVNTKAIDEDGDVQAAWTGVSFVV